MFKLLTLLVIVNAEVFYTELNNGYIFGELNTCINIVGHVFKCSKVDSSTAYCYSYKDTSCTIVDKQDQVPAFYTEPTMKYKLFAYKDAQCGSKLQYGVLTNDKTKVEKFNECFTDDDEIPMKWICGKGYTLNNGDCAKSGDNDVKTYGDPNGCQSGSNYVSKSCSYNGAKDSANINVCSTCKSGYQKDTVTVCGESYNYCTYTGGDGGNDGPATAGSLAISILFAGLLMILI